jgi:FixJ family two-component response regulator
MAARISDRPSAAAVVRLVDGDRLWLRSLALLLRRSGFRVDTFDTTAAFLARRDDDEPGCVVLDLDMPEAGVLAVQRAIAAAENALPVIFLTRHGDLQASGRASKNGAIDFLTKPVGADELINGVRRAIALDEAARSERRARRDLRARYESLTSREREVFALVARGLLNKQIAWELGTSERTIKAHRANVMRKMALDSIVDLVRAAAGLSDLEQPVANRRLRD